jgi:hypothetical protein
LCHKRELVCDVSDDVLGEYQTVPLNFVMQTEERGESRVERCDRFDYNIGNIVASCVQPSSQGTYTKVWIEAVYRRGIVSRIPKDLSDTDGYHSYI